MNDITDFISAAIEEKPVAAQKAFAAAMEPKIQAALETQYDAVTQSVFNPQMEEEPEDVELAADEVVDEVEVEEPVDVESELESEMEEPNDE